MSEGEFVKLGCRPAVLRSLATGLTGFGPTGGSPDWLVSAVWLRTEREDYLATASVVVLPDGFVARGLCVATPSEVTEHVEAELPDISGRLRARGNGMSLPEIPGALPAPEALTPWSGVYGMSVLVRVAQCRSRIHRLACALLFEGEGSRLLVGTDPSTLAMVFSEDQELIARYGRDCEQLTPEDYLGRYGG